MSVAFTKLFWVGVYVVPPIPCPTASVDPSVAVTVTELLTANVFPFVRVKVPVVAEMVSPLRVVAWAAPRIGVTSVGELAKTSAPEPVSSVTAAFKFRLDGVARNVATPVPRPVTPPTGSVQFVSVPEVGVPRIGVTNVGDVLSTTLPDPVAATASAAVPPEFVRQNLLPVDESAGNFAKPVSINPNSVRTAELSPNALCPGLPLLV